MVNNTEKKDRINSKDIDRNNQLENFVRTEWFSFFKWTTGISTFIISVLLAVITLVNSLSLIPKITAGITLFVLVFEIILIWTLLKKAIFEVYNVMDLAKKGFYDEKKLKDMEIKFNNAKECIKNLEPWIFKIFIFGIILFLVFFLVILIN